MEYVNRIKSKRGLTKSIQLNVFNKNYYSNRPCDKSHTKFNWNCIFKYIFFINEITNTYIKYKNFNVCYNNRGLFNLILRWIGISNILLFNN